MKNAKLKQKEDDLRELKQNIDLVINPMSKVRQAQRNAVLVETEKQLDSFKSKKSNRKKSAAAAADGMDDDS